MTTIWDLWSEARNPPAEPTGLSFQDKAVLVTGANSGLGYASAVKYAVLGASPLILAVRSQEKGDAARASIIHETGHTGEIIILILELSSFESVNTFVNELNERVAKLDVALLCAGIVVPDYRTGSDGYEMTTQVNVLSNTLLALRILPKLRAAASSEGDCLPHLCFMNSLASHAVDPEWLPSAGQTLLIGTLNDPSKFDLTRHYYLTKLAAWFAISRIARVVEHSEANRDEHKVIINACCPGMCRTNMQRDLPWYMRLSQQAFLLPLSRSVEEGSRSLVSATGLGPESMGKLWRKSAGRFWREDGYLEPSDFLKSERGQELADDTWNEILAILQPYLDQGDFEF
ncbi:hypothetical protein F5B22DRAFT_647389 [Xylaria bambusicola]|uniref:uncharacterized protein n=1 Tax=Xylaria bambusicola TaxID=326684 RepID=UPI002007CC9A|nr:uncharacterized protein F5B22DRAFT_647389 [Xylaria bambusicola]KAI0514634.1 hypothetical protein F5B22DRAFT_647389 [Xylaria bambusicola]